MSEAYDCRAEEAEEQARRAATDDERHAFLEIAKLWRELAARKRAKHPPGA